MITSYLTAVCSTNVCFLRNLTLLLELLVLYGLAWLDMSDFEIHRDTDFFS